MANVAALRKKAADFEQKKQLDKAISAYREILDIFDAGGDDNVDVGLYNRVGDLLVRQGSTPEAVQLYERAVDLYAEGGFFNNAIALCNKILRTSPGRATVYYKLGKISAAKGFNADAKSNFLEYADRMQKAGQMEEAFRALKEFADLCPDQDDIRLMLAEQLTKADRKPEALEQLQLLYARYDGAGRTAEAQATLERMKSIDPNAEAKSAEAGKRAKSDDLVFIDLDAPTPRASRHTRGISTKIEKIDIPPTPPPTPAPASAVEIVPTSVSGSHAPVSRPAPGAIDGLEITSFGEPEISEPAPLPVSEFAAIDLSAITEVPIGPHVTSDLALPGDLPLINLDGTPIAGIERIRDSSSVPTIDLDLPPFDVSDAPAVQGFSDAMVRDATPLAPFALEIVDLEITAPRAIEPPIVEPPTDISPIVETAFVEPVFAEAALTEPASVEAELAEPLVVEPVVVEPVVVDPTIVEPDLSVFESVPPEVVVLNTADPGALVADVPEPPTAGEEIIADASDQAPPPHIRRTTSVLANSVGMLGVRLVDDGENWALHREYAESLFENGDREAGLKELETALVGFEKANDLEAARSVADEIIRLNPTSVRHHQKRVEYAFRSNDKSRLAEAYVQLADALFRDGQAEKAKQVYQRVLELSPDDERARTAIEAFGTPPAATEATAAPRGSTRAGRAHTPSKGGRRYTAALDAVPAPPSVQEPAAAAPAGGDDDFVSLGDWLRDQEAPKSTRMVVDEEAPTGDEQADFADMLRKFKQGVAENVDAEDHESHYDLGVAYKEMGLLDEAISEFQKALRGHLNRVRTYEALGQCFLEKKQLPVAATILNRALNEPGARDEQLVGVLYLLGYINESLGKPADAKPFYERVFGVDIQFRDVGDRLNAVDKAIKP